MRERVQKWKRAWQQQSQRLHRETYAVYLAYRDPRTPWYARVFAACVLAYALSPIDLIPDPIPVLGYLDDLILIPLGVTLALQMIPAPVIAECREQARLAAESESGLPSSRWAFAIVLATWSVILLVAIIAIT